MNEFTRIIEGVQRGDSGAADQLLALVYGELRRLAADKMKAEAHGHTLQPTALVHEAWLRLATPGGRPWQNRGHFFAAAAEAMRRILIDHARRKHALKRGALPQRAELDEVEIVLAAPPEELLAIHEALDLLERDDPHAAELVKLRYFVGMTMDEAASSMGLAKRTAEGLWTYARAKLRRFLQTNS